MLLRVAVRSVVRRLPCHANKVVSYVGAGAKASKSVRWVSDDARKAALDEYRNVVAELTAYEDTTPKDVASVETLLEWDKQKLETLSLDQLEELGRAWFDGVDDDFPQNLTRAFEVWSVAASMGSAESGYSRAVMMREGRGVPQDSEAAFQALLHVANTKNYGMAHYAVAIMYTNGEGTAQDFERAFHHNWQASLCGVIPSIYNVANAMALGRGTEKDERKAAHFYECAVQAGDPAAKFTLGTWLYTGKGVGKVDKKRAFQLQFEAAEAGHGVAMFNTGSAYLEGTVVDTNYVEAANWFEKAAQTGFPEAAVNLAMIYRRGMGEGAIGVPRDLKKSLEILKRFSQYPMCAELVVAVEQELRAEEGK